MNTLGRERSVFLELAVLFLPSIPALLWLWPNIRDETALAAVQSIAYAYVLIGVLWIGLRRFSWDQLGVNRRGFRLSLLCGGVLIALRILAQAGFGLPVSFIPFRWPPFLWDVFFYFCLVGAVEELLFRGLLFRALEDWRGPVAAIVGSAVGFALWHIGWAGPLMIGHFAIGLYFGLIRWRSRSITGLILVHGLHDLLAVRLAEPIQPDRILEAIARREVASGWLVLGDALLIGAVVYLLFLHPRLSRGEESGGAPGGR